MKFVAYIRVSTDRQHVSGLGEAAQRADIARFVGSKGEVIAEFSDVQSGRKDKRPGLREAVEFAKAHGAALIVARMDRLGRKASYLMTLRDSGLDIFVVDLGGRVDKMQFGMIALMAERERDLIKARAEATIAVRRARGDVIGNANFGDYASAAGLASGLVRQAAAVARYSNELVSLIEAKRETGSTLREIADHLNKKRVVNPSGKGWNHTLVRRILDTLVDEA